MLGAMQRSEIALRRQKNRLLSISKRPTIAISMDKTLIVGMERMTQYRYETHLHTSETSRCGSSSGSDYVLHFKRLGYAGIFVTDHFLNGNTTVCDNVPWSERIELFCRGYDVARKKGLEVGLDVFFGWEYSYGWAHLLTYGLGKDWLLSNPDLLSWDVLRYCDRVHEDGGSVIHAHPFREGVDIVNLLPNHVDAVEVLNGGRGDEYNRHALDYATSFDLPQVAGSDTHSIKMKRLYGMGFHRRLRNVKDYTMAIKAGEGVMIEMSLDDSSPVAKQEKHTEYPNNRHLP